MIPEQSQLVSRTQYRLRSLFALTTICGVVLLIVVPLVQLRGPLAWVVAVPILASICASWICFSKATEERSPVERFGLITGGAISVASGAGGVLVAWIV